MFSKFRRTPVQWLGGVYNSRTQQTISKNQKSGLILFFHIQSGLQPAPPVSLHSAQILFLISSFLSVVACLMQSHTSAFAWLRPSSHPQIHLHQSWWRMCFPSPQQEHRTASPCLQLLFESLGNNTFCLLTREHVRGWLLFDEEYPRRKNSRLENESVKRFVNFGKRQCNND